MSSQRTIFVLCYPLSHEAIVTFLFLIVNNGLFTLYFFRFFGTQKWPIQAILSVHFRVFMSFLQDAIFASCLFICGKDSKTRSLFQGQKTNHSSSYLEIKKCSMWKWFLILKPNKGVYLATLWKWGFLGLRNGLLKQFFCDFQGFHVIFTRRHFCQLPFHLWKRFKNQEPISRKENWP